MCVILTSGFQNYSVLLVVLGDIAEMNLLAN